MTVTGRELKEDCVRLVAARDAAVEPAERERFDRSIAGVRGLLARQLHYLAAKRVRLLAEIAAIDRELSQ